MERKSPTTRAPTPSACARHRAHPVPEIRLHGTVEPLDRAERFLGEEAVKGPRRPCSRAPTVLRRRRHGSLRGEFVVQVFDQGEPGSSQEEITGDSFSIELIGGAYNGYTRGGYIEGGNVQVEP